MKKPQRKWETVLLNIILVFEALYYIWNELATSHQHQIENAENSSESKSSFIHKKEQNKKNNKQKSHPGEK